METVIDYIMEYLQLLIDNKIVQFVTAFVVICAVLLLAGCADNSAITKLSLESVSIDQRLLDLEKVIDKIPEKNRPAARRAAKQLKNFAEERDTFAMIGDPAIEDVRRIALAYAKTRASYITLYNLVYNKDNGFRLWKKLSFMEKAVLTRVHKDIDTLDKRVIEAYSGIVDANSLKKDIASAFEIFAFGVEKIIPVLVKS